MPKQSCTDSETVTDRKVYDRDIRGDVWPIVQIMQKLYCLNDSDKLKDTDSNSESNFPKFEKNHHRESSFCL